MPVRIVSEGEALAISLIENSEREGLDPFDVLRAYRMLAEEGRSVDYIAALFLCRAAYGQTAHEARQRIA